MANMPVQIDWSELYSDLMSDRETKRGIAAARLLERDIRLNGWLVGRVFADRPELAKRYGLGRRTLVEAVRLLEDRGIARMRRGPGGGLIVLEVCRSRSLKLLNEHFVAAGTTVAHIREARLVIRIIADYLRLHRRGPAALEVFNGYFMRGLATTRREDPLANIVAAGAIQDPAPPGDPIIDFLNDSLDRFSRLVALTDAPAASDEMNIRVPANRPKTSLASLVAKRIVEEIRNGDSHDLQRLGTEAEIGERMGVSRQVVRQAVRILESQGTVESRRGRTHGISVTDPESTVAAEAVVALLSSMRIDEANVRAACSAMGRLTRILVAAKAGPEHFKEYERLVDCGHTWGGINMFSQWVRLDWEIIDNPILRIFAQALTGCQVRLSNDVCAVPMEGMPGVQRGLADHIEAAKKGDLLLADRLHDELTMLVRAAFHPA